MNALQTVTGADLPLVAAPMAGGTTNPTFVHAVTESGAFAFLAAGYKQPDAVDEEMKALDPEA